jgi:hypothetical protein
MCESYFMKKPSNPVYFRDLGIFQTPEHSGNASMHHNNTLQSLSTLCRISTAVQHIFHFSRPHNLSPSPMFHFPQPFPSKPQHPSTPLPHPPLILWPLLSPHLRRLHIRRTLIIRLRQHTHDRNQDLLHALDWRPAF